MAEIAEPNRLPATPKVSVAMITYNHARYVEQAVRSVLGQRVPFDFEIVIGDDASTDGTQEILRKLQAERPDRIRLIQHETNLGMLGKLNGLAVTNACQGDYVAFLEGDDYWVQPEKLARQVAELDAKPALSGCYSPVWVETDGQTRKISVGCDPNEDGLLDLVGLLERGCPHTPSVMLRRRCLPTHFPDWYFTFLMGDWATFLLALQHGPFRCLPQEPLSVYRVHSAGYWTGKKLVARTVEEQKALRAFRTHLGSDYFQAIDRQLAKRLAYLAEGYAADGDRALARRHFVEFLRTWPRYRAISARRTLGLGLSLYAPRVLSALRRLKQPAPRT